MSYLFYFLSLQSFSFLFWEEGGESVCVCVNLCALYVYMCVLRPEEDWWSWELREKLSKLHGASQYGAFIPPWPLHQRLP